MFRRMKEFLEADPSIVGLKYVLNCSRRFGKTFTLLVLADAFCRKNPGCHVRFAAPSKTQLKLIIHPSMTKILETCPPHIAPRWRTGDSLYQYPNGSQLHLAGCDDSESMEALRGTESHLNIVTEGGSIARLEYLLSDILIPQTLTTKGKTFVDSTPPPDPNHHFNILVDEAKKVRNYSEYTIDDNTSIDQATKEVFIKEAGGRNSPTCQREYFCKRVRDEKNAIIPEFDASRHAKDFEIPKNFESLDRYIAMDLGLVDKTVVLYGYYDFLEGILKIQSESVLQGRDMKSSNLGDEIKKKREGLWGDLKSYREVADNNELRTLNDINAAYGFNFVPVKKETLTGMVNRVRNLFGDDRIQISYDCVELLGCLESGVWDKRRRSFATHSVWGHFDALAALVYLVLNLDESRNPLPSRKYDRRQFMVMEEVSESIEKIKEKFGWKKSI